MKWGTYYSPIGLDIGSSQVKMVQLKGHEQQCVVHHIAVAPLADDREKGRAADQEQVVRCLITMREGGFFTGNKVVSALPCNDVDIRIIHAPLQATPQEVRNLVRQEAESYLPYSLEEAIFDSIAAGQESGAGAKKQRLILASARKQQVHNYLAFLQKAGLQCQALDIFPLALRRLILWRQPLSTANPLLVVDLGCRQSTAFVLWQGALMYSRTFTWGGALLTQAIMKDLKLNHEKAELIKQQHGIDPQTAGLPKLIETSQRINMAALPGIVCEIVRPELEYLAQELERILSYWGAQFRGAMIDHMLLSGGSAALNNLDGYLQRRIGIDVTVVEPLSHFHRNRTPGQEPGLTPALANAVGLALRGMPRHG